MACFGALNPHLSRRLAEIRYLDTVKDDNAVRFCEWCWTVVDVSIHRVYLCLFHACLCCLQYPSQDVRIKTHLIDAHTSITLISGVDVVPGDVGNAIFLPEVHRYMPTRLCTAAFAMPPVRPARLVSAGTR